MMYNLIDRTAQGIWYYHSIKLNMVRPILQTKSLSTFCDRYKGQPCHDKIRTPVVRIQSINMIDSRLLRIWSVATSRSFFHLKNFSRNNFPRRSMVFFHLYLLQYSHFSRFCFSRVFSGCSLWNSISLPASPKTLDFTIF